MKWKIENVDRGEDYKDDDEQQQVVNVDDMVEWRMEQCGRMSRGWKAEGERQKDYELENTRGR